MQPGTIFFERSGHDAVVVIDPATGAATSYNFGFFDPDEPDFISNFVHGHMRYRLQALPFADDLAYYRDVGRGVSIQWLNLSDDARSEEHTSDLQSLIRISYAVYCLQKIKRITHYP